MGLRTKILLPLFCFGALVVTYLYAYWMPHSLSHSVAEYHKSTERHIDSVIEGLIPLLLGHQLDTIHENLNTLGHKNYNWVSIRLVSPEGKTIYPLQARKLPAGAAMQDVHIFEKQIGYLGMDLGKLIVHEDCGPRLDVIREVHKELIVYILISMAVFFVAVGFVLDRIVSRPVKALADASKRLADGNFDVPVLKMGDDEVGTLVTGFLDMRDAIKGYQADLLRKNALLYEQHEFLQTIIESLTQPFYVIDIATYKVLLANRAAYHGPETLETMTCYKMTHNRDKPCTGAEHPCSIAEVKKTGKPAILEHRHPGEDGSERFYEIYAYPIFDRKGGMAKVIEYCVDITDKKSAEAEQERMTVQLLHMQKMEAIGTLAGGIAHDFNNILTAIIGYSEMALYNVPEEGKLRGFLGKILEGGNRARKLVQQILSFSRQTKTARAPVKIQTTVQEALTLLRASIPTTIEIRTNIDEECGAVLADTTQIHQVVMNLGTNAYHAMRKTGGVLGVSLKHVEIKRDGRTTAGLVLGPGEYLKLEVSDTGHGMEQAVLKRIFEPFFTTKETGEGSGMGLAVVHGIVKSHGGHITVYSEPNIGTTFNVYLPVYKSGLEEQKAEISHETFPSFESLPGGDERILLVDDEAEIVSMGRQILEKLGYKVRTFTNSLEALEAFNAHPEAFDLIITDMNMPLMNGTELAGKILAIRPDMPIVLCTGFSELIDGDRAKVLGIREYVMKPMLIAEIAVVIRKVLNEGKVGQAL